LKIHAQRAHDVSKLAKIPQEREKVYGPNSRATKMTCKKSKCAGRLQTIINRRLCEKAMTAKTNKGATTNRER
jgi:hypothetical protein